MHDQTPPDVALRQTRADFASVRVDDLTANERYKLMTGAIVPRPIAWVSTIGLDGTANLAPFSFFNGVCSSPMCLMISVGYSSNGELKDTARNILETGEFIVHQSPRWAVEQVHQSSASWDYSVNEIERLGLQTLPSTLVRPPRIAQSPIHMECTLRDQLQIGEPMTGGSLLLVGEIVHVHIQRSAYVNGRVLLDQIEPIARMGGPTYMEVGPTFQRARAKV